jgi:outer membrane receptor protein involved in Fe transport
VKVKNALGAGLVGALACTIIGDATAQETAPATDTQLEAIVVTSQKRREDVQEIPLSVSAISGEALKDNQIVDFTDLSRNIPNVSFMSQAGAGLSTLEIRGVTSQAGSATVGLYLDDVSLTTRNLYSQGMAEPRFFDIERVEVLRGPQGTLYGAGSMGGTLRFLSNQPDPSGFSGTASAQISETEHGGTNYEAQAVLNLPLSPTTAVRMGVEEGHDSGYIDQVSPSTLQVINKGINSANWSVEKLALKTQINSDWKVTPSVFAQQYRSADIDAAYLNVPSYQVGNGQTGLTGPPLGLYQISKVEREPGDDRLAVYDLTVNGDLHFADLALVYSNYRRNFDRIQDGTYVNSNDIAYELSTVLGNAPLVNTVNALPSVVFLNNTIRTNSFEVRLTSKEYDPAKSPFTWVAGAYDAHTKTDVADNEPVFGITQAFAAAGVPLNSYSSPLPGSFPGAFGSYPYGSDPDNSYYSARHYDDKQFSLFGELTTHFGPTVRMITGLRWIDASENFNREGAYYFTDFPGISEASLSNTSAAFTPRFALDWDVDPTTTAYTNIAKGFRVGGANRPIPPSFQALGNYVEPQTFQSDSLWSYELGSKSRLLDKRLTLNLAAYLINWNNIQQDVAGLPGGFDYETNAGKARITGFELESAYRLTRALTLTAAGNLTRAVFTQSVPELQGLTSGEYIQGVPKFSLHLGVQDRFPINDLWSGVWRLNGNWTGTSSGTWVTSSPDYVRPQYFTCDASVGVSYGRWEFGAFVKNLNDNHTPIQQMQIQDLNEAVYLRPRTIGLSVTGSF